MAYHHQHPTSHSHSHHREMHVAHRRVKHVLASGGYTHGGAAHPGVQNGHKMVRNRLRVGHDEESFHTGEMYKGHLGLRSRAYAAGGGVMHKITPSKRKPHLSVNVFNIHKGHKMMPGGAPMMGAGAPPPLPVPAPGAAPMGGPPMRPPGMKRGGKIEKFQMGGMSMHPLVANRRARLAGAPHVAAARTAARIAAAPHMARAQRAGRMATGLPPQPYAIGGDVQGERISGLSTAGNIAKWQKYAQKDTRITRIPTHKKGGRITGMKQVNSPQLDDIRDDAASGWPSGRSRPKALKMPSPRVLPEGNLKDVEPSTSPPTGLTVMKLAKMRQGRRFSGGMGTLEESRHYVGKWPPKGGGK